MRKALSIGLVLAMLGLMAVLSGSLAGVAAARPLHAVTDTPTSTPVTQTNTPTPTPPPEEPPPPPSPTPPTLLPEAGSSGPDAGSVLAIAVLAMLGLGAVEFVLARRRAV